MSRRVKENIVVVAFKVRLRLSFSFAHAVATAGATKPLDGWKYGNEREEREERGEETVLR